MRLRIYWPVVGLVWIGFAIFAGAMAARWVLLSVADELAVRFGHLVH